jgi:hypothetical protein
MDENADKMKDPQRIHPLLRLVHWYVEQFPHIKEENESLDNAAFNRDWGLELKVPVDWPTVDSTVDLIHAMDKQTKGAPAKVLVVYPRRDIYNRLYKTLGDEVSFMCHAEIFEAMHRSREDGRLIKDLNRLLSETDLVVSFGTSSTAPEVKSHLQHFCSGCLILFG